MDKVIYIICGLACGMLVNVSRALYEMAYQTSLSFFKSQAQIMKNNNVAKDIKHENK